MEWLVGIALVVGGWLLWKVAQAFSAKRYMSEIAARMSLEEAQAEYDRCVGLVLVNMSPISHGSVGDKEAQECLERAVWMRDRINKLTGKEHGDAFRVRHRFELLNELKSFSNSMGSR